MKNVFLNVRTAKAQAGCAKLKDTSRSFRRGLGRGFLFTFLLLTLCVGQMWAGAGLYEVYFEYSYNGTSSSKTCTSSSGESNDLGTLTADFKLTSIYPKVWKDDGSGNICGCLMEYYISSDQELTGFSYDKSLGGKNHQWKRTTAFTVAQYNTGASGSYTFWYRFKAWGSSSSSSNCGDNNYYIPSDGSSKNKFTYKIAPPAVSSFAVSTTGSNILSGSGTSGDPYIIAYNGNLVLTLSGNKGRTDANSSLQYNTSGSWNSTTSRTISSITSTTKTSVTVKMRCYNSTASLSGTESTKTIYYKSEPSYSVTFADDGNGSVTAPASSPKTVGKNSGIAINASANSGYSFDTWTISSGSGSFTSAATTASNTFKPTAASTITASFKPDWALYNGSTLLGIFTKVSDTQYTLSVDLSKANHHQLQFKKDGADGYIVGAEDPTSTFRNLSISAGYFDWNNITNVVTGTYFITLKYESPTWKYKAEQKYILTYDANGATSGTAPVDASSPYMPNAAITTAANSGSLAKSSFNFTGWNTRADGQGTHYNVSTANAFNITANTTLYAEWTPNVPSSACLDGDFGSVTMNKSTSGCTTTFTYTFYDKAAGTYNFYLKDCSSSTALLKATNGVTMTQTGCTSIASTGASNYYFRVVTGAAGDITITATYNTSAKTINMDVTRVAIDAVTPSWWLIGDAALFTNWNTDNHSYPLNRSYRGMSDVFYRVVDFGGNTTAYFKPLKGNTRYGHNEGGGNKTVTTGTQYAIKATSSDGTAFKTNGQGVVWCVVDQTNNKFWEQNPTTYYTITLANGSSGNTGNGVAGTEGTVTLTTNNLGNLKTKQYESGERVNISVSAKSGYYVDDITIGATSVATDVLASSYSGYTTMPSGNATLTVTYKPLYSVTFGVGTGMSSYGSVSNNLSISSGTKVLTGTSITFTATPNLGYKFVGWYREAACTNQVSTDNPYTFSVTAATNLYAKFEVRNLYIHADFISNWATPALMTQSTANRAVYTYTINNMAILASAQVGDAWNTGYHFHFVNTVANPNDNIAYNYNGVQTPTYSGSSIDGVHKTHTDNATIEFGLTRKSNVTITLILQSIDDATKPTLNIAADPIYTITHGDPTHGSYTIKVGSASAVGTSTESVATTTITLAATPATGYHFDHWTVTKAGGGTVTVTSNQFTMPSDDVTVAATFLPSSYDVTLKANGGSGADKVVSATYDAAMPSILKGGESLTAHTRTGYNFAGYYDDASTGTQYYTNMLGSARAWDKASATNLFAHWSAKTYTITLTQSSETGYGSSGTAYVTATYDAALPTIASLPTAAQGYAFMGYYTGHNGTGTQYYGPTGNKLVATYTTAGGIELFAYFKKAEITNLTFDAAVVAPSTPVGVTPTVAPTPTGTNSICWKLLYNNGNLYDPQPTFSPANPGGVGNKVTFNAPPTSGMYLVAAVLRTGNECDGGTLLDSVTYPFQVAGDHTVTVQYKCGNTTIKASTTVTGKPLQWTEITAPEIVGYSFSKWVEGDGITIDGATEGEIASATINFKAIYDGKLTAVYTQKRMIYFYNTLNWENVYVYFYKNDSYWGPSNQGTGANTGWQFSGYPYSEGKHGQMLPVYEGSKIYYFDAEEAGVNASYTNVAFTELDQHGCDYFYNNNKVVRRGDYHATTMPLFVPLSDQPAVSKNSGKATYYCEGYWMNYPANSGYTLRIYDSPYANNATGASREFLIPFSEDVKMPLKQEVEVNFSGQSWFIIYRNDGTYLEGSHTFKQTDHGDKKITSNPDASKAKKMTLISDGSGIYTFTLTFRGDGGSPENYDYYLNVDFPAAVGDYRIVYSDNATWSNGAHSAGWYHPSDIIGKNTSETEAKKDTVSFFISHGSSPSMKFQYISAINGTTGAVTWIDVPSGSITIPTSITASGVYNFIVTQPAGGASISLVKAEPYTGNYYIRTDCAGETKWNNFRSPDHLITYSEYSITHGGYSHYYAHWVQNDDKKNIQFCIANDYSSAISDTLIRENNSDPAWTYINNYIDVNGNILRNANVRFMWNQSTNKVSRAYVDGAQGTGSNNFLYMLSEDNKIRKTDESALDDHKVFFSDNENWIYEANIQAQPKAAIKLLSNWGTSNTITQYFKGSSSSTEDLIDGSGEKWYNIRLLYDFKTNRLVAAMVPTGNIDAPTPIHADVMFIREHQGDIDQLTFTNDGSITDIETAYAVMRFNKWTLNNKEKTGSHNPLASPASIYERSLYYVSFPFRVKLSEVFGFGTYGQHWIIQRYRGDLRAQTGWWEGQPGFWEFIWNRNGEVYLEPNQGYILTLETELLGEESSVWGPDSRSSQIELFFPSYGTMPNITNTSITQNVPAHKCTINRAETEGLPDTSDPSTSYNRTIFDSHWNIMSVPTYVNANNPSLATTTWLANDSCPRFLYTWNPDDNTLTATSGTGFVYHAMHAYTVQYYGNVTWTTSVSPAAAPQRNTEYRGEYEFCLEVLQDELMIDRTFVRLSDDEKVTAGFEFGEDMTKQFNSRKANIYTIAGNTSLAGNSLPMSENTTIVPVGVSVKKTGDYTFSIPDGTNGIGITLIDEETGIRTSLSALDYTVELAAGDYTERFWLEISPVKGAETGIDPGVDARENGVRKVMIDGILYIIRDGKMYDARGARVE